MSCFFDLSLLKLAKTRLEIGEKIYGSKWKTLSKEELLKMIDEELADTINYLSFCRKKRFLDTEKYNDLVDEICKLYHNIHKEVGK